MAQVVTITKCDNRKRRLSIVAIPAPKTRRTSKATAALEKKLHEAMNSKELDCPPDFSPNRLTIESYITEPGGRIGEIFLAYGRIPFLRPPKSVKLCGARPLRSHYPPISAQLQNLFDNCRKIRQKKIAMNFSHPRRFQQQ